MQSDGGNGGHLSTRPRISRDDVLYYLMSESAIASSTGAQLEAMRQGIGGRRRRGSARAATADAVTRQHAAALRFAAVSRCVSQLRMRARVIGAERLRRFSSRIGAHEGAVVVGVLTHYQRWATQSQERALACVAIWMSRLDEASRDVEPDGLAQAFREGKALRARAAALGILGEAHCALGDWVERYNARS